MTISVNGDTGIIFPDSSLQSAAASPFVLKNRIINSDMRIDQRNAGASVTASATNVVTYTLDRWAYNQNIASKYTIQQNAGSITPPVGFNNYLGVTSTSAYSVASSDFAQVEQRIEGYNVADLGFGTANAKTITLSFWVRSSLTGTFGAWLGNGAGDRVYPISYSISSANTWEQKTITIAGDTSGTWLATNGSGLKIVFVLGYGSTYQGTVTNTWNAATFYVPTGATSVVGTNGATFYITGVQLEIGSTATPFERRLYNQELANCQRYYYQITGGGTNTFSAVAIGLVYSTTAVNGYFSLPVSMRTAPTLNYSGTITLDCGNGSTAVTSFGTVYGGTSSCWGQLIGSGGGLTAGRAANVYCNNATTNYFTFSAEL